MWQVVSGIRGALEGCDGWAVARNLPEVADGGRAVATARPTRSSSPRRLAGSASGYARPMKITATENGPLRVEGASALELFDHDGSAIDAGGKDTVFLCRCGGSTNKPFCDGTHSKVGFDGAAAAVREADGA
jgi:CDGSH-type Zn-finger protein